MTLCDITNVIIIFHRRKITTVIMDALSLVLKSITVYKFERKKKEKMF